MSDPPSSTSTGRSDTGSSTPERPATHADVSEQLFADFLERYHEGLAEPEQLFAAHPEHAPTLRRWWQRLVEAGETRGPTARAGDERFGPFVLLRRLGTGAQGTVHLAEDTRLGRRIALKVLPLHRAVRDEALQRFRREAEVASRLDHPGICTVFESGEHDGLAYIAMQHVDGESLAQRLAALREQDRPMAVDAALSIAEQVADALHSAHSSGLVHRDIKPGNIMLTSGDRPVVLDFGLARDAEQQSDLTRTGDLLGTPAYMSPEQLHGSRFDVDARTDVYSLGVTLFECLTLQRPFEAPTQEQLLQAILTAPLPDPTTLRRDLDRNTRLVLQTALAKDREHRYASASAFAADLRRLRRRESVLARPVGALQRTWSWCRRFPALASTLLLFVLTLLAGTVVSLLLWLDADASRSAYESLADLDRLRVAERDADELFPARPEHAERIAAWLANVGHPLAGRLPMHRRALAELRQQALPDDPQIIARDRRLHPHQDRLRELRERREDFAAELGNGRLSSQLRTIQAARVAMLDREIDGLQAEVDAYRRIRFADTEIEFLHDRLARLVRNLEQFTANDGTLRSVERRLDWAQHVHERTIAMHRRAWQTAIDEVRASATYGHRELAPQLGLVPLGRDPASGLQEFAVAVAGELPQRDDAGQLRIDADSAPVLVLIPARQCLIGASLDRDHERFDRAARADEGPPVTRSLDWFLLGKHEVSRAQWRRLGGVDRALPHAPELGADADLHPITAVTWWECHEVLQRHELVLPSEAQWEMATRAGSSQRWWTGARDVSLLGAANFSDDGSDGGVLTMPIATLRANGYGLHHTSGNVAEWCRDATRGPHRQAVGDNAEGVVQSTITKRRAVRGGSYMRWPRQGRTTSRGNRDSNARFAEVGVRLLRRVQPGR